MKKIHVGTVEAKGACKRKDFTIYEDEAGNRFIKEKQWIEFKNQFVYVPVKLVFALDHSYYVYERI